MDPLEGSRIRDWQIVRRLAAGGMGVVYEAVHTGIGRKAAVKVLAEELAHEPEYAARVGAEARALAGIAHRGVVQVFDAGELPDGRPWLAMEFLEGETLSALLKRGRPPLNRAIEILDQLLSALAAAHAGGLIHRDVKPANIFIVSRPFEAPFVKVMDFGLVRLAPPGTSVPQTYQDRFVGTPGYMAPEQALAKAVGPQTDLYSVGVIAFALFTGEHPFTHQDPMQLARLHVEAKAPKPSKVNPELPPALDRWVGALLEKDPSRRPADAEAVRRELQWTTGKTEETPAYVPSAPVAPSVVASNPTVSLGAPSTTPQLPAPGPTLSNRPVFPEPRSSGSAILPLPSEPQPPAGTGQPSWVWLALGGVLLALAGWLVGRS
jgi:eukaryotic-like serine/threonine-protein kinase